MPLTQPRKILFVNPSSRITGAEVVLLELMEHLPVASYQPFLLCPSKGPLSEAAENKGIPTFILPSIPTSGRASDNYKQMVGATSKIVRLLRANGIALVHANTPRAAYHAGLAARLTGLPSIIHVRDYRFPPFHSKLKSIYLNAISDLVLVISEATQKGIAPGLAALARKVHVVYDGIPPGQPVTDETIRATRQEFGIAEDGILLASVGWIEKLKGQEVAIRAMAQIVEKYPKARLVLVGNPLDIEGEIYKAGLIRLVNQLKLGQAVVFAGYRQDVPAIMASMDLLLHPAILPEALGHVLLEAGRCAKATVASRIGGIPEVILHNETGLLVAPGDAEELANAAIDLLSNRQKRLQLGEAAQKRIAEKFSIQAHVAHIINWYEKLL
jgi:glycosyltransferase involved in cell wall biosynthesis